MQAVQNNQPGLIPEILRFSSDFKSLSDAFLFALQINSACCAELLVTNGITMEKAIEHKNSLVIAALLDRGTCFSHEEQRQAAIHISIINKDSVCLKKILSLCDELEFESRINFVKLGLKVGAIDCVKLLYTLVFSDETQTNLLTASLEGSASAIGIKFLAENLTLPNAKQVVLLEATSYLRTDCIELILTPEDDEKIKSTIIRRITRWERAKLLYLLDYGLNDEFVLLELIKNQVINELRNDSSPLDLEDKYNCIPQRAIYFDKEKALQTLIKAGITIDSSPHQKFNCIGTPIMMATWLSKENFVKLLLDANAQLHHQFPSESYFGLDEKTRLSPTCYGGYTVIHLAFRNHTLLKLLISAKQFNQRVLALTTDDGYTALHLAAKCGDIEATKLLLAAGAKLNTQNREGASPLYEAIVQENISLINLFLTFNGTLNATNKEQELVLNKLRNSAKLPEELIILYIMILFHRHYLGNNNQKTYFALLQHFIEYNQIIPLTQMIAYLPTYCKVSPNQLSLAFNWLSECVTKPTDTNPYLSSVKFAIEKKHWRCTKLLLEVKIDSSLKMQSNQLPLKDYLRELLCAKGFWKLIDALNTHFETPQLKHTTITERNPHLTSLSRRIN